MEADLSDDDKFLMTIYEWIDTIPLSKDKKNIARDFSDGMLLAEIIKYYYPKLIDVHSYPSASSTKQKLSNWSTMNLKVFKKLNLNIKQNDINDVIASKPKAIEKILIKIYQLINKDAVVPKGISDEKSTIHNINHNLNEIDQIEAEIKSMDKEYAKYYKRKEELEMELSRNSQISNDLLVKIKKLKKMLL